MGMWRVNPIRTKQGLICQTGRHLPLLEACVGGDHPGANAPVQGRRADVRCNRLLGVRLVFYRLESSLSINLRRSTITADLATAGPITFASSDEIKLLESEYRYGNRTHG